MLDRLLGPHPSLGRLVEELDGRQLVLRRPRLVAVAVQRRDRQQGLQHGGGGWCPRRKCQAEEGAAELQDIEADGCE